MTTQPQDWREAYADYWARGIIEGISREFPANMSHMSMDASDCDVTPSTLHPAFWGCFDWHSCAHMQWSALVLLREASDHLAPATRQTLIEELDSHLTPANLAVETEYFTAHPSYERPYGWAWVFALAAEAATSPVPQAAAWSAALAPLIDAIATHLTGWLPRLTYPVRYGVHDNTAFGLALILDAARTLGRDDLAAAISNRCLEWFGADENYPIAWEPSGNDFLSAGLSEAFLMRRVLGEQEFATWLAKFLPNLGAETDPLLQLPTVIDRTDGKLVHLFGLMLSRAWMLRDLAPVLDDAAQQRIVSITPGFIDAAEREIVEGDYMSTHWLVSFALKAVLAAE